MSILFYGVETWLLLCIMCGTKRLTAFSHYTRPVRYFRSARVYLLFFMDQIRVKARPACTVAKAENIQWRKMQWRICAKWHQWQSDVWALSNNLCIIYRHNFYES